MRVRNLPAFLTPTLLLLSLVLPLGARALVIDNFEEGAFALFAVTSEPSVTLIQSGLSPSNVLGGTRRVFTTLFTGPSTSCELSLSAGDDGPVLTVAAFGPGSSGNCGFQYGPNLNLDLTADGADRFRVVVSEVAGQAFAAFAVRVHSGANSESLQTSGPISPGIFEFPFALFSGGVDFADIDLIQLSWVGAAFGTEITLGATDFRTVPEPGADDDEDGVPNVEDECPDTVIPESVPTRRLGVNRFALVDDDGFFDTTPPAGEGPGRSYTIEDTAGCSCEQIIDALGLGAGHEKFGCSISAMDDWVAPVNQ